MQRALPHVLSTPHCVSNAVRLFFAAIAHKKTHVLNEENLFVQLFPGPATAG
jgi:hypothetical protein